MKIIIWISFDPFFCCCNKNGIFQTFWLRHVTSEHCILNAKRECQCMQNEPVDYSSVLWTIVKLKIPLEHWTLFNWCLLTLCSIGWLSFVSNARNSSLISMTIELHVLYQVGSSFIHHSFWIFIRLNCDSICENDASTHWLNDANSMHLMIFHDGKTHTFATNSIWIFPIRSILNHDCDIV